MRINSGRPVFADVDVDVATAADDDDDVVWWSEDLRRWRFCECDGGKIEKSDDVVMGGVDVLWYVLIVHVISSSWMSSPISSSSSSSCFTIIISSKSLSSPSPSPSCCCCCCDGNTGDDVAASQRRTRYNTRIKKRRYTAYYVYRINFAWDYHYG